MSRRRKRNRYSLRQALFSTQVATASGPKFASQGVHESDKADRWCFCKEFRGYFERASARERKSLKRCLQRNLCRLTVALP